MSLYIRLAIAVAAACILAEAVDFKEQLKAAQAATDEILKTLHERWRIDQYPNFLRR
jgi:hypothetical protein